MQTASLSVVLICAFALCGESHVFSMRSDKDEEEEDLFSDFSMPSLNGLSLHLQETISRLLSNDPALTTLTYGWGVETDIRAITAALQYNKTLTFLNLRFCDAGDRGAMLVAAALKKNPSLTTLKMKWSKIEDRGGTALGEALETNTTLTKLDLKSNWITEEGWKSMLPSFEKNTILMALDVRNNKLSAEVFAVLERIVKRNQQAHVWPY